MSSIESWAYLSRTIEGPSPHLQALLAAGRDADEIARGVRTRASWIRGLAGPTEQRYAKNLAADDLETAAELGYTLLTPDSPTWPQEVITEGWAGFEGDPDPNGCQPHALWVKGETNLPKLLAQSVAFVGTRAASIHGHHATANLVNGLAAHRYTIVSGGALGIDTVAHQTALAANAPTVMITACGPGVTYPKPNAQLYEDIPARGGAVITEYPPYKSPDRHRFLTRNRLIAGLSNGTVVVEASYRSGALNTVNWAHGLKRSVMAVPGSIMEPSSLGTNLLMYKGRRRWCSTQTKFVSTSTQSGRWTRRRSKKRSRGRCSPSRRCKNSRATS
ncbi:DNA-processing protein DprA [Corynebacterium aquatimens]|uniref:DNA-processing protein DprA n=1 Tax=Corynebacterium aquatimens TaxID=1190508 RepID=UPI0025410AD6|nr:DNA-processing protein DprA [Corynebacterium aquatimens]